MTSAHFPQLSDEMTRRLDVAGPRYTSYPTVVEWGSLGPHDAENALARAGADPAPLSLYVHIPFCREMCSYCGCHVIITKNRAKGDEYLALLRREAALVRRALGGRKAISRVHLGGGTPTFLDEEQLAELHAILADAFDILPDADLAVEVNPSVTRPTQLEVLARAGFRRISFGVQDLDEDVQRAVGRSQTEADTRAAVDFARSIGFRSVNLDLIYGLPRQTVASWRRTIARIADLAPDRISLFSFAYVPAVKPHQRRLAVAELPTGATKLELFRTGHDGLVDAGYCAIGMDHFALPDDELARALRDGRLWRDFQGYSAGRGGAGTIALGVSGIGDVGGAYVQNVKTLPRYAEALAEGRLPVERGWVRTPDDERRRAIIGDVMCNLRATLADDELDAFAPELDALRPLCDDGLCVVDGGRIDLTPLGRVFVRNVAMVFDAYRGRTSARRPVFSRTV
jgi:oxygen-independent coproporphyrinogen-3 oxidase